MTDEDRAVWETIRRHTTELAGMLNDASQTPCSEGQSLAVMRALFLLDEARAYFNGYAATRLVPLQR
jgi:hypothetical protein